MSNTWKIQINLADVFHNNTMTFIERRDAIVQRLLTSRWLAGRDETDDVVGLVRDDLAFAGSEDEFDEWWGDVYDAADDDRVWITTR